MRLEELISNHTKEVIIRRKIGEDFMLMNLVCQKAEIVQSTKNNNLIQDLTDFAKVSTLSEKRLGEYDLTFLKTLIRKRHMSVFEHVNFTYKIRTNRGVSHELVRHRKLSVTQESTRRVKYDKLILCSSDLNNISKFKTVYDTIALYYNINKNDKSLDRLRGILPIDLKTELYVTGSIRAFFEMFLARSGKDVHPDFRELVKLMTAFPGTNKFDSVLSVLWREYKGEIDHE